MLVEGTYAAILTSPVTTRAGCKFHLYEAPNPLLLAVQSGPSTRSVGNQSKNCYPLPELLNSAVPPSPQVKRASARASLSPALRPHPLYDWSSVETSRATIGQNRRGRERHVYKGPNRKLGAEESSGPVVGSGGNGAPRGTSVRAAGAGDRGPEIPARYR